MTLASSKTNKTLEKPKGTVIGFGSAEIGVEKLAKYARLARKAVARAMPRKVECALFFDEA